MTDVEMEAAGNRADFQKVTAASQYEDDAGSRETRWKVRDGIKNRDGSHEVGVEDPFGMGNRDGSHAAGVEDPFGMEKREGSRETGAEGQWEDGRYVMEGERIDDLQCRGYRLIQKPEGFCFGVDAVLLSDFVKVRKGQKVLDLCTGSGVIPILLAAKTEGQFFTGLELQEDYADMAARSVRLNGLEDRIRIVCGDVKKVREVFAPSSASVVTVNPPYMINQHGLLNVYEPKTIARHEVALCLEDVISAAAHVLPDTGKFFMIHKPFRLAEIFRLMKQYHLEPKRMRLIHPYVDKEPTMVMVEGVKGGRERITIEPPLVIYREPKVYSDEIFRIYGKRRL